MNSYIENNTLIRNIHQNFLDFISCYRILILTNNKNVLRKSKRKKIFDECFTKTKQKKKICGPKNLEKINL